jgi:DNA ligase-1
MSAFKPQLAKDYNEDKLKFPLYVLPKVDGVRMINLKGEALGRSLKPHGNLYTTDKFSNYFFDGLDGEMVLGNNPTAPNLCSNTSGAISRIKGEPEMYWWCFDLLNDQTKELGYIDRYRKMFRKVHELQLVGYVNILAMPIAMVRDLDELKTYEDDYLIQGYEGVIIRSPEAKYKQGRSSSTKADYWRIKRFTDAEAICTSLNEGDTNLNEAKVNELGHTERSSHKGNLQNNGMIGSLSCTLIEDLFSTTGELQVKAGTVITVSPGVLTLEERKYYWENKQDMVGKVIKFKSFAFGNKDKPRFPTYLSQRVQSDMS